MRFLKLNRIKRINASTIGELYLTDSSPLFLCHTLEDVVRKPGVKIDGETAIPEGEYAVIIDYSSRFKTNMPHILKTNLKELDTFKGVRIHPGNYSKDTDGCILVGEWDGKSDFIIKSRDTYKKVFPIFDNIIKEQNFIKLFIKNGEGVMI